MKFKKFFSSVLKELFDFSYYFFEGFLPRTSVQWLITCVWSCFIVFNFTFYSTCVSAFSFFGFDLTSNEVIYISGLLIVYFALFFFQFFAFGLFNWISERFNIRNFKKRKDLD